MEKPKITDIKLNKEGTVSPPVMKEIRIDWDNNRHHLIMIYPPFTRNSVVKALKATIDIVSSDENLY